jgi:hypothetical protein
MVFVRYLEAFIELCRRREDNGGYHCGSIEDTLIAVMQREWGQLDQDLRRVARSRSVAIDLGGAVFRDWTKLRLMDIQATNADNAIPNARHQLRMEGWQPDTFHQMLRVRVVSVAEPYTPGTNPRRPQPQTYQVLVEGFWYPDVTDLLEEVQSDDYELPTFPHLR